MNYAWDIVSQLWELIALLFCGGITLVFVGFGIAWLIGGLCSMWQSIREANK